LVWFVVCRRELNPVIELRYKDMAYQTQTKIAALVLSTLSTVCNKKAELHPDQQGIAIGGLQVE